MAQRHPAHQQFAWHSGTHATRPAAISMAQRRTRHTRDTPDAHRHSLPLRSTAQGRTRDMPDAACRCVPRNVRSKLTFANPRIPLRLPRFRNAQRAPAHAICRTGPRKPAILATAHNSLRLPRGSTVQCLPERINASEVPHLPRETQVAAQRVKSCACATRPEPNPHGRAPPARPRHASQHARSPQPATRTRQKCARRPRTRSQCARRHSESVAPSRIPAQGHGFENLVVATPPP